MHTVKIKIPDELSSKEISLSIAKHLYEQALVSVEQAAKMAGVDEKEFSDSELTKGRAEAWSRFKNTTAEQVLQEQIKKQDYTGLNKAEMDALRDSIDIQEPFELLLSQLTK